ncbi:YfbU family protein [Pseudomonas asplenii]|uniref:YfbU family protein n=1 Tax=Pseudomonas asplenii TaxID=53407 RepID=UPI002234982E|nr:YfbU family protein [Pseudomonas asplenii]UZE27759.1 YfbU family protein [Pseudomonas asplenii]
MQPTAIEQLTVQMLCAIYKKLDITDSFDPDLVASAISGNDLWVLDWAYDIRDENTSTPPHVKSVVDTLDMYSFLRDSFNALSPDEQALVEAEVPGGSTGVQFFGYDGNNETEYRSAARYLVEDLDRFGSMRDVATLNSHCPVVERYERMYEVFEPIRGSLVQRLMSPEEIISVLAAQLHPDNRG